jgi:hypothetical protein
VRDPEIFGKLAVLGDDANMVDGGEPKWLDSGEQGRMVDKNRDGGDFDGEAGSDFVSGAILDVMDGMNTNVLVGVLVVLVNAQGVGEDDCGRNVLLVVKVRERWQGTGRRDRGQG